ncbi:MAG TPA: FIST N-terminal domain-containing protein [Phycisphaerales bacterium]|nr:FIST N-terminal domain-containing protein [Phycisphaerales bacterium]
MHQTSTKPQLTIGSGVSGHLDASMAAEYAVGRCAEGLAAGSSAQPRANMAVVFFSMHHADSAAAIAEVIRKRIDPEVLIGCSAEAVIGGEIEMENSPGVAILAASMPGVKVHAYSTDELPLPKEGANAVPGVAPVIDPEPLGRAAGLAVDHRATILLADPFSVPLNALLPLMASARNEATGHRPDPNYAGSLLRRSSPIIGGLASGSNKPGGNVLLLNDRLQRSGGVGISLSGKIRVDSLVSQGCRPIGPTLIVTGCKGQMITHLGGRPALDALEEVLDSLGPAMRERLRRGLFIGRAINEYKDRFGRDDFLIRHVIGVDKEHKSIAVADLLRVGQTVQFHVRDAQTAGEDLALLLDMQKLYEPPAGVLLFTCNGRGTRLFDRPHHDAAAFARAFAPPVAAEQQAKGGTAIGPGAGVPLAGFFCAGEIGPVGDQVFVHGQTACAAIFRPLN